MNTEQLTISSDTAGNHVRVVHLTGVLTIRTIFDFQTEVRSKEFEKLVIDLSKVDYADSAGLGALLAAYTSAQRRQAKFALAGANSRILTLLEITHTDKFFPRYASSEEAVSALG